MRRAALSKPLRRGRYAAQGHRLAADLDPTINELLTGFDLHRDNVTFTQVPLALSWQPPPPRSRPSLPPLPAQDERVALALVVVHAAMRRRDPAAPDPDPPAEWLERAHLAPGELRGLANILE